MASDGACLLRTCPPMPHSIRTCPMAQRRAWSEAALACHIWQAPTGMTTCLDVHGSHVTAANSDVHSQLRVWDMAAARLVDRFSLPPYCKGVRCLARYSEHCILASARERRTRIAVQRRLRTCSSGARAKLTTPGGMIMWCGPAPSTTRAISSQRARSARAPS